MADNDIKIGITTKADTAGAEAAEASLKKVREAAEEAAPQGFGRDTGVEARIAEQEKKEAEEELSRTKRLAEEKAKAAAAEQAAREVEAEAAEESRKDQEAEITLAREETQQRIRRAVAMGEAAQNFSRIGKFLSENFREAAGEVGEFDEAAAAALRNTASNIDEATNAASALISGFASGGPLGLGLAAAGLAVGKLAEAFIAAEVAAAKAAAEEQAALEKTAQAARDAAEAAGERANEIKSEDVLNAIELENTALARQIGLLEETFALAREKRAEAEEIAKAQDALSRARIKEDEASGKITPEQATQQRDRISREAEARGSDERKRSADEVAALAEDKRKAAEEDSSKRDAAAAFAAADEDAARKLLEEKNAEVAVRSAEVRAKREIVNAGRPMTPMDFDEHISDQDIEAMYAAQVGQELYDSIEPSLPEAETRLKDTRSERDIAAAKLTSAADNRKTLTDEAEAARIRETESAATAQKLREKAARTTSTVDEVSAIRDQERAAQQRAREAERMEEERLEEERDIDREGRTVPGQVEKGLKGAGDVPVTRAVNAAADKLKDGATADEYAGLGQALEGFVSAAANMSSGQKKQLNDLAKSVNNLAQRLKNIGG